MAQWGQEGTRLAMHGARHVRARIVRCRCLESSGCAVGCGGLWPKSPTTPHRTGRRSSRVTRSQGNEETGACNTESALLGETGGWRCSANMLSQRTIPRGEEYRSSQERRRAARFSCVAASRAGRKERRTRGSGDGSRGPAVTPLSGRETRTINGPAKDVDGRVSLRARGLIESTAPSLVAKSLTARCS